MITCPWSRSNPAFRMAHKIVILEDNAERQRAMQGWLREHFYSFEAHFFAVASEIIDYLRDHLSEAIAISLDHDLELLPGSDGSLVDPSTGREVAEFLATCSPVCPVIIHTTNSPAAVGMEMVLQEANWETRRVVPHDDLVWIEEDWFPALRCVT